jgi:hypothetical protein
MGQQLSGDESPKPRLSTANDAGVFDGGDKYLFRKIYECFTLVRNHLDREWDSARGTLDYIGKERQVSLTVGLVSQNQPERPYCLAENVGSSL